MAHKSDIGGTVPGSGSGTAREIFEEGLHLPAVKFMDAGRPVPELEWLIHANSRTPEVVVGDIRGQVGANRLGGKAAGRVAGQERQVHGGGLHRGAWRDMPSAGCGRSSPHGPTAATGEKPASTTTASTSTSRCASASPWRRPATASCSTSPNAAPRPPDRPTSALPWYGPAATTASSPSSTRFCPSTRAWPGW